ncbi:MAG: alpha/beta hydrolase [Acidobacteria bacterium]|nr:alpha/beta hydrolase [Acidobacteriota bacterium]
MAYLRVRGDGGTLFPKERCLVASDGTHVAYTIRGAGPHVVALCAGYCCPDNFWRYLAPALARRYRVLVWNYRGTGVSGLPRSPGWRAMRLRAEDFAIERNAADLAGILDREGIREISVLGHSMGVQVCLETYRLLRERVRAIVAVTGPYASPVATFYDSRWMERLFPAARLAIQTFPRPTLLAWRALFASPLPHRVAQAAGALGPAARYADMRLYYRHLGSLDPLVMMKMAEAMHRHSAEDLLREIAAPTLVVVGERDRFTPSWLGRVMAARIPDAELALIPGGTHGALIEHPKLVNRAVLDFLGRRLGPRSALGPAPRSALGPAPGARVSGARGRRPPARHARP